MPGSPLDVSRMSPFRSHAGPFEGSDASPGLKYEKWVTFPEILKPDAALATLLLATIFSGTLSVDAQVFGADAYRI